MGYVLAVLAVLCMLAGGFGDHVRTTNCGQQGDSDVSDLIMAYCGEPSFGQDSARSNGR